MKISSFFIAAALAAAQTRPTTAQQATNCAQNFAGSNNTGTVTCYNVDKKLADQINQLVGASKRDGKTLKDISDKIEALLKELQNPPPTITMQAPNGINIGPGAIVPNPQVNNFGPPPPHLRFTEEVTVPLSADGAVEKILKVHIFTDRSIPGAVIGLIFSGPIDLQSRPDLVRANATQFDFGQVARGGIPVPNSLAVTISIPAAFMPVQEFIVPIKSKTDVHVLEVFPIGN
jgi:hypothetical protein